MKSYLVESYVPCSPAVLEASRERARKTAELGAAVLYVRSTYVPGDEVALHLFEAPSIEALEEAGRRAALEFERIVEATDHLFVPERDGPRGKEKGTWSERGS